MNRTYPQLPVCAVSAILFREHKVLLVQRGKPPAYGKWSIPGGVVKLGETLEAAVIREVREETSLLVHPVRLGKVVERIFRDDDSSIQYHYVILDYVCELVEGNPVAASDAQAVQFADIDSLDHLDMTEGTTEVIREAYRELGS